MSLGLAASLAAVSPDVGLFIAFGFCDSTDVVATDQLLIVLEHAMEQFIHAHVCFQIVRLLAFVVAMAEPFGRFGDFGFGSVELVILSYHCPDSGVRVAQELPVPAGLLRLAQRIEVVFHLVRTLNRYTKSGFVFPAVQHQIGLPGH